MGRSLPVLDFSQIAGKLDALQQQVRRFVTAPAMPAGQSGLPAGAPADGRTVDEFKPFLVALNLTKRCNLKCAHCYLDATTKAGGFMVVFGTNGMLINDRMAKELVEIGVMGVGISIDSLDPQKHDRFRGLPGAWAGAVAGIEACKRNGLQFQVHFSAQPMNYRELPDVVEWAHTLGAKVLNVFFMVCTGRGEELTDITPAQYEEVLSYLVNCQDQYQDMLVRARCAPHFKRLAYEKDPDSPITKARGYMGGGCLAGTNYARVTPNGELTPCPNMPLSAGNIRETSFVDLWEKSDIFDSFRYPQLKGKCGDCEYTDICGGCRARPYVDHGDWLDEDQWCLYTPKGGEKIKVAFNTPEESHVAWDEDSETRLNRI